MAGAVADESPEQRTLSLLNEGISSLESLPQLARRPPVLTTINLHCNRITAISGLDHLAPCLTSLNLSSNRLRSMGGVWALAQLEVLDLSCNEISAIDGLASLVRLKKLLLSYNWIESLAGASCPLLLARAAPRTDFALRLTPISLPPCRARRDGAGARVGSGAPGVIRQPHQPAARGRVPAGLAAAVHVGAAAASAGQPCLRCSHLPLALRLSPPAAPDAGWALNCRPGHAAAAAAAPARRCWAAAEAAPRGCGASPTARVGAAPSPPAPPPPSARVRTGPRAPAGPATPLANERSAPAAAHTKYRRGGGAARGCIGRERVRRRTGRSGRFKVAWGVGAGRL